MSSFKNTYQPPKKDIPRDIHLHTPPDQYDFNFCFEVKQLASDRVELRPFIPSLYAQLFLDEAKKCDPILTRWLPVDFYGIEDVLVAVEANLRAPSDACGYAIFTAPPGSSGPVDPKDYVIAGMCALYHSDVDMMSSELGWMIVLDPFQRTHVLTHTAGLLIHRILDMPSEGGLGLRRCQWFASSLNDKSQGAAKRLGFREDGVIRNHRVLTKGRDGARPGRKGDYKEDCMSRDSWLGSISWDQWEGEGGVREHIDKLMARR
ncbi:hypothetical protein IAT38_007628 [Cryptococcus sp. DSM 104549]